MSQDYSPSLVTKNLVFCGDAAMKSAADPATLLYDKVNDNNGTMYNGTCFDFDGTDDLVLTSDPVITGTGDFTITAWINRATVNTYDFICGNYGIGNTGGIEVYGKIDGTVILYIGAALTTSTVMTADTWYHYAATRTSGACKVYMNGVLDVSGTLASSIVGNNDFSIGNGEDYTSENFDGKIADVKVFDVALSAANIKELYDDSKVIIPTKNAAAGGFVSQTNLIGWWPLAEGAGDICYDGSGNGYHGTASNTDGDEWLTGQTGCPQLVEGYNRPMLFNGSSDYVYFGSYANVAGASYGTVSAWIYLTGAANDHATIYTCQTGASWRNMRLVLNIKAPNIVRFHLSNGTSYLANSLVSSALNYNQWYHVAGTYNGTTAKIYIDGSLNASYTTSITPGSFNAAFTAIGYMDYSNRYFPGIINEVAVYDSALTLAQVGVLATTGPNGGPLPPNPAAGLSTLPSTTNLIGYWRNDNNVTWTDLSGNGKTGTVSGAPPSLLFKQGYNGQKNVNTGRDGQGFPLLYENNGAIGFNGSDDYVNLGTGSDWTVAAGEDVSLFAWIKTTQSTEAQIVRVSYTAPYLILGIASGKLRASIHDGTTGANDENNNGQTVNDGVWHYVGVVFNRDSNLVFYKDGVSATGVDISSVTGSITTPNPYAAMGRRPNGAHYFNGQIANATFYKRALTYAEIQQNYKSFKTRFGK